MKIYIIFFLLFLNTKSKFTIQLFEIDREMGKSVCVVFLVGGVWGVWKLIRLKKMNLQCFTLGRCREILFEKI